MYLVTEKGKLFERVECKAFIIIFIVRLLKKEVFMFMKELIVLMLIMCLLISMVGCGVMSNPVVPPLETTDDEDLFLAKVVDSQSDIQFIAEKDGEVLAFLAEKDVQGNPIEIRGVAHLSDDDEFLIIIAGENGLPETIIDSKGNRIEFTNYTNLTAEVYWYDEQDELIQGPITIDIDEQDLLELEQIYFDFNSKSAKGKINNIIKWGILGTKGVVCVGGLSFTGPNPPVLIVCGSTIFGVVAALTVNEIDDAASFTIGAASCYGGDFLSCASTLNDVVDEMLEDHNQPPTPLSPGLSSAPGPIIYTLTPTLTWEEVDNADYYDLAIREYPYNTNIIYNFQEIYESSFVVPSERLETWKKYCWNVRAHKSNGFSNYSETLYFQIENVISELLTITTITASAGPHGSITPSGDVIVNHGSDKSFTISSDAGYQIDDVLVDGSSVGAVSSYTFTNVTEDHTISANFIPVGGINHVPVISSLKASPSSIDINQTATITCTASDEDVGDTLTYTWNKNGGTFKGSTSGSTIIWKAPSTEGNYTVECEVSDGEASDSKSVNISVGSPTAINQPPYIPNTPIGLSEGVTGTLYSFLTSTIDPNRDNISYKFDWGDGNISGWTSYISSGNSITLSHSYSSTGTYYVKVKAKDSQEVESGWSNGHQIKISLSTTSPVAPSMLSATTLSQNNIVLVWQDNSNNEIGFKIERKTGTTGIFTQIAIIEANAGTGSGVYCEDTGLIANTTYCYRVRAYNITGNSSYSKEICATTNPSTILPTAITGLATNITSNSATLNGTVNPNGVATGAFFQWGTTTLYGNLTTSQVLGSGINNINISSNLSGLLSNTTYHFRIVATNSNSGTTFGEDKLFTTMSPQPSLKFTNLTPSQIATSTAPYQAILSASGSKFNNVNRVSFSWSGAASGSATWYKGDTNWNTKVTVNSDTSMTLKPGVVETNPTWSGKVYWTVTLRDTTGATASRSFTVTYTPRNKK
jgi:hypothetical protein